MDVLWAKISSLVCTLLLALLFGILPYFLILRQRGGSNDSTLRRERIIKLANCFAGGVFLGALFLSMMPEGSEVFENYKSLIGYESEFPFYNVIMVTGFFLTAAIEYFAHVIIHHKHDGEAQPDSCPHHCLPEESQRLHNGARSNYGGVKEQDTSIMPNPEHHSQTPSCILKANDSLESRPFLSATRDNMVEKEDTIIFRSADTDRSPKLRSILLLLALSFHSVFDGLALGLQDSTSKVWEIFAAVALHKCIVSFCLGLEVFTTASSPKVAAVWMGVFALISPFGTGIGICLTSTGINEVARGLSSSILQALACGAFLYVTFMEILSTSWKQDNNSNRSFLDIICAFVGFTVMVIAVIWDE